MLKHAYLIIANNSYKQLCLLIKSLDYYKNDIYIIIDKKSKLSLSKHIKTIYSNIYYLSSINIYWGTYSQIDAEIRLFKSSYFNKYSEYKYYHVISGKDFPITSQKNIHNFFDNHEGYEFIEYQKSKMDAVKYKVKPHLFRKLYNDGVRNNNSEFPLHVRLFYSIYRRLESFFLQFMYENKDYSKISTASNWVSIENDLVKLIIDNEIFIKELFKKGKTVDELFIPTLLNYYPEFLHKVYDKKEYYYSPNNPLSNLRYIKKNAVDSHPKTLNMDDYSEIVKAKNCGYLFARKFDYTLDKQIINKILNDID